MTACCCRHKQVRTCAVVVISRNARIRKPTQAAEMRVQSVPISGWHEVPRGKAPATRDPPERALAAGSGRGRGKRVEESQSSPSPDHHSSPHRCPARARPRPRSAHSPAHRTHRVEQPGRSSKTSLTRLSKEEGRRHHNAREASRHARAVGRPVRLRDGRSCAPVCLGADGQDHLLRPM